MVKDVAKKGLSLVKGEAGQRLQQIIFDEVAQEHALSLADVYMEHPQTEGFGDYSTNIAMVLASKVKSLPRELAQSIVERLNKNKDFGEIAEISHVAGPGFINIRLKTDYFINTLNRVIKDKDSFGWGDEYLEKKIMVEFTDPNPFKEFHIGHLYSNTVGESLSRLFESQGGEVLRACYQGDVGMHVAKAIWGLIRKFKKQGVEEAERLSLQERAKLLGEAYAVGANAFEEDEEAKLEITEINKKIYAQDQEVWEIYKAGKRWSLEYFDTIYARLGTKFDKFYFESDAAKVGMTVVGEGLAKGVFEKSQGAVVFPGEKYGLHTRVFVNSLGLPTYEAKELGLAPKKYEDYKYDRSIIVTGNEIDDYFKVLLKALELISPELSKRTVHVSHGMVRLPQGKMSSRKGNVITGEWLIEEAKKIAYQKMKGSDKGDKDNTRPVGKPENADERTVEAVAIGAIKYALLRSSLGKDVEFDFEESINFEGNSGPYLQYTYARTQSILKKGSKFKVQSSVGDLKFQMNEEEKRVLRWIARFHEAVAGAALGLSPSDLCTYLYEMATRYNAFYNKHSVLGKGSDPSSRPSEDVTRFRVLLTAAVGQVIKNGLWLLGINAPERM